MRKMENPAVKSPDILSGIQPTGELHFGNYFGAVKNWVSLQEKYQCMYVIVDLHGMTLPYDPASLRQNTEQMAIDLLACGIDPEKSTLFIQSFIPEHTELFWILSCHTSHGGLGRMVQFKEKSEQSDFVTTGLFSYPVLQCADILVYKARYVPVGRDQEQHLELARDVARRFNQTFNTAIFPEPKPLFTSTPKIMSLADPFRKMSKSAGAAHYIGLFEDEPSIRKKVKAAVTDAGPAGEGQISPGIVNLFEILRACEMQSLANEMNDQYLSRTLKYSALKEHVANALVQVSAKLIARRHELSADKAYIYKSMSMMCERARSIARSTLREVRELVGLTRLEHWLPESRTSAVDGWGLD